jgi:HAD superfamily hydrolase (TIGR01509 family)
VSALETLFLDAGGVLVHPNWVRVSDTLQRHGVTVAADALAKADLLAKRTFDTPEPPKVTSDAERGWFYFNLLLEKAGLARSAAIDAAVVELGAYHRDHNLWEHVPAEVVPCLERLRASGLKLVVVSNANGTVAQMFDRLGLARFFDHIFDSQVEGVEKPDPRFFRIALEGSGSQAETTLHVGDLYYVDVTGARSAGIRAALLDPAGLYEGFDCPRYASLTGLVDGVLDEARGAARREEGRE